ncbi:bifunctional diguanylate cyclase/phosphodiesterase [Motilimonas eburnea]|uniref:bifunctional diguanylate cyclase/phosphodiesterase n=1 Tax=Motilimonas eburnea TaxID=1737488 RepID=UPI001E40D317|nr:EAL domain-containing protein [Motilimonas eburnea]MCE2573590.1 EAL domain-containing protein [Motilimonas eburnea]
MTHTRLDTRKVLFRHPPYLYAFISVIVCALLSYVTIDALHQAWKKEQTATLSLIAEQQAELLSQSINQGLNSAVLLGKHVEYSQGQLTHFEQHAHYLQQQNKAISSLQLAPIGIISHVYPLAGNEAVIGHNILQHDQRKQEAQQAILKQQMTVAGPFNLIQGGLGIIGRYPVFIEQQGESVFWGFASVVLAVEPLLNGNNLTALDNHHIQFQLHTYRLVGEPHQQVLGAAQLNGDITASASLSLNDNHWQLTLSQALPEQQGLLIKMGLVAFLLTGVLTSFVYKQTNAPYRMAENVANQTQQLSRLAYYDNLTGLKNRSFLQLELGKALANLDRHNQHNQDHQIAALVYLGVDDFKRLNDAFGNKVGDELLLETTARLKQVCNEAHVITRAGGDEFAIILPPQSSIKAIELWLQQLLQTLGQPMAVDHHQLQFSISAGVALLPQDGDRAEVLIQHANLAMTQAKQKGKRRFMFYNASMEALVKSNISVELELNQALERDELVLFYQPIVELSSANPVGFEALIRWQHPSKGLIFPDAFIPVAEQSHLITEIGYWVLEAACKALPQFPPHVYISINVSARQFMDPQLSMRMKQIIHQYQTNPNRITLEITETLLIENIEQVVSSLKSLRDFGLGISVDDFGTGHSSLSKLKVMPINTLKVDRAFIMDLPDNKEDKELTEAILLMAQKLSLKVVAEGVETAEQQAFLLEHKCNFGQGYYFSKPVPLAQALAYTEQRLIKK